MFGEYSSEFLEIYDNRFGIGEGGGLLSAAVTFPDLG